MLYMFLDLAFIYNDKGELRLKHFANKLKKAIQDHIEEVKSTELSTGLNDTFYYNGQYKAFGDVLCIIDELLENHDGGGGKYEIVHLNPGLKRIQYNTYYNCANIQAAILKHKEKGFLASDIKQVIHHNKHKHYASDLVEINSAIKPEEESL